MYLNQFSVRILGGKEQSGGYVELEHGKQYSLVLRNDRGQKCDAYVEIDGKHIGTWRIPAQISVTIERPAHDQGRFTFYEVGSPEAAQAGLVEGHPNLGLVKVTFTPERKLAVRPLTATATWPTMLPYPWYFGDTGNRPVYYGPIDPIGDGPTCRSVSDGGTMTACNYHAGGTGLSGQSGQAFVEVAPVDPDFSQQTVIHLRLVGRSRTGEVRPLTTYSTPVPPPIGNETRNE